MRADLADAQAGPEFFNEKGGPRTAYLAEQALREICIGQVPHPTKARDFDVTTIRHVLTGIIKPPSTVKPGFPQNPSVAGIQEFQQPSNVQLIVLPAYLP